MERCPGAPETAPAAAFSVPISEWQDDSDECLTAATDLLGPAHTLPICANAQEEESGACRGGCRVRCVSSAMRQEPHRLRVHAWCFVPGRVRHRHFATEAMRVKAHRAPCKDFYVHVYAAFIYATFTNLQKPTHAWFRPPPIEKHAQAVHILSLSPSVPHVRIISRAQAPSLSISLFLPISPSLFFSSTLSLTHSHTLPFTLTQSVPLHLSHTHMHTRTLMHCLPRAFQLILFSFFSQTPLRHSFLCLESKVFL